MANGWLGSRIIMRRRANSACSSKSVLNSQKFANSNATCLQSVLFESMQTQLLHGVYTHKMEEKRKKWSNLIS